MKKLILSVFASALFGICISQSQSFAGSFESSRYKTLNNKNQIAKPAFKSHSGYSGLGHKGGVFAGHANKHNTNPIHGYGVGDSNSSGEEYDDDEYGYDEDLASLGDIIKNARKELEKSRNTMEKFGNLTLSTGNRVRDDWNDIGNQKSKQGNQKRASIDFSNSDFDEDREYKEVRKSRNWIGRAKDRRRLNDARNKAYGVSPHKGSGQTNWSSSLY
jgi:hypothetical protein